MKTALSDYIDSRLEDVDKFKSISIHLNKVGIDGVAESIEVFHNIVKHLDNLQVGYKVILVLPLETLSDSLSMEIPRNLKDIESESSKEPSSLYVTVEDIWSYKELSEEYKYPLNPDLYEIEDDDLVLYYREYRSILEMDNSWEFSRAIYLESFTHRYLPSNE